MRFLRRLMCVLLAAALAPVLLASCEISPGGQQGAFTAYKSFRDVPGITADEIGAIEALRKQVGSFVYGMHPSTEAFYDAHGEIRGYSVLFCAWLSELFGIRFTPAIYAWDDLLTGLDSGAIDFTGRLMATEERRKIYLMTDAIAARSIKYMRLAKSTPLMEIAALRTPRYAFLDGSITIDAVRSCSEHAFDTVIVNDYSAAYDILQSGQADAFFDDSSAEAAFDIYGDVIAEDFFPLIYKPISLSTKNSALEPIISVVQKILQNGGKEYFDSLYALGQREYMRHKLYMRLNDEERAYLRSHSVIPFAAEFDNYPISFYNANDKEWQGIAFDVLREVEALTGLSFKRINDQPTGWLVLFDMLEKGEAFLVTELLRSQDREGRFIWPQTGIMTDSYALLSKSEYRDVSLNDVWNVAVGVAKNTAYADFFKRWYPNHMKVVEYVSSDDVFNALHRGEVDLVMSSSRWLLALTNFQEITGYKANIVFDRVSTSVFGFTKAEAVLCSLVDKAMQLVDIKRLSGRWLHKTYDYQGRLARAQRPWLIGASGLLLCTLILLFIVFWRKRHEGIRLEDLVSKRTAQLEATQRDVKTALEAAEVANRSKSAFLANMSHEIRTPMNAILGITEIQMQDDTLAASIREAFGRIYSSGDMLLGIINDILDMSKIEAGKLELLPVAYEVASLINDTVQLHMMRIGSKEITFELHVDENTPAMVVGDVLRVKQILNNVLSNAFKYTTHGVVTLSVSAEAGSVENESGLTLVFLVSDTGQGMTAEQVSRLFDEYSRFNVEANRTTEGTGLGMSITQNLVRLMDGEILVDSVPGRGTTVTLRLPQGDAGAGALGRELAENLRQFRINGAAHMKRVQILRDPMPYGSVLVVDDVETNIYVTRGLLAPYGLTVDSVESGFAAIERIKQGKVYDIVFMDHMMPEMDGIEATKALRDLGYTKPVVALTANAVIGRAEMFLQSGLDDFISKPIDLREMNAVLNKFVRDRYPPEVVAAARRQHYDSQETTDDATLWASANPKLAKLFIHDASKSIAALEAFCAKRDAYSDEEIRSYVINVHGMKSSLANIGESKLSALAAGLEQAGRERDTAAMASQTPAFLSALREVSAKITHGEEVETCVTTDEDRAFLREKLLALQAACVAYNKKAANEALAGIGQQAWPSPTRERLDAIAEHLLHSKFKQIIRVVDEMLSTP